MNINPIYFTNSDLCNLIFEQLYFKKTLAYRQISNLPKVMEYNHFTTTFNLPYTLIDNHNNHNPIPGMSKELLLEQIRDLAIKTHILLPIYKDIVLVTFRSFTKINYNSWKDTTA